MPRLTAGEVAETTGGRLVGSPQATAGAVVADTRTLAPGEAFAAIRGGVEHVTEAVRKHAPFVIVPPDAPLPDAATAIVVDDVTEALGALAAAVHRRLGVRTVAITGSTGKTLTKDLTAAALGASLHVHRTPGSYNAEIGLPLVVLSCPDDVDVLILEMGARHPGDIENLCRIVRPQIGVITGIGLTHLEVFGDRPTIARSKAELVASLPPDGLAVLPSTDDYLDVLVGATSAPVHTVGPGGHTRVLTLSTDTEGRAEARVALGGSTVEVRLPVPGRALVRNAAFALAVCDALSADLQDAARAIEHAPVSSWRMQTVEVGGRLVLNDAYNANPTSTSAALHTAREIARGRELWAVLGVMAELGPASDAEHVRIGRLARALGFTGLIAVGDDAAGIASGAGGVARRAADADEAVRILASDAAADAVVLVKGSRVAALEHVAADLADAIEVS